MAGGVLQVDESANERGGGGLYSEREGRRAELSVNSTAVWEHEGTGDGRADRSACSSLSWMAGGAGT